MKIEDIRIGQRVKCKNQDLAKSFGIGTVILLSEDEGVGLRNEKGDQIIVHLDGLIPEDEWKKSTRKKTGEKQEYTVSMRVDGRVDVTVEATSFEEAFELAKSKQWDPTQVECVEFVPVNATDSSGEMRDYH